MRQTVASPDRKQSRSTQSDFLPENFQGIEEELAYYKQEYKRLKAIIALQKQKIKRLIQA